MMVFLSHYPEDVSDVRDGMSQRIVAIDSIFRNVERAYLNISFRWHKRHQVRARGLVRIELVNFYLHHRSIVQYLRRAELVYVHSIHNAIFIAPYLKHFRDKLVVDLHGIVPEETVFLGKPTWARVLSRVERRAIHDARRVVVVTQRMADHLMSKYRGRIDPARLLLLPNVDLTGVAVRERGLREGARNCIRIIYAGGAGTWQKTDLLLRTLFRMQTLGRQFQAYIYVQPESVAHLQKEVMKLSLSGGVVVGSLSHEQILHEYQSADLGFVLRDDILLNQVAMPTKLAEYMANGVVPIVLSPDLGDSLKYGYRYLTIENLFDADKLKPGVLREMRVENFRVMAEMSAQAREARELLRSMVAR